MRRLSVVAVAMILAIALYFTVFWGYAGLRMLTSPSYGLDDVWHSQIVFTLGQPFALSPTGLLKLAAFLATLKLAVACICAAHIIDRLRSLIGGTAEPAIFEAGLILVVAISILSAGPAVWSQNAELLREDAFQLVLAGFAAAFCVLERRYNDANALEETVATAQVAPTAQGAWFAPWR